MPHNQTPHETLLLLQTSTDHQLKLEVRFQEGAFWINQKKLAALFGVEISTITYRLKEIFDSGEIDEASAARKIRIQQQEGRRQISRELLFYNMEVVIALGYRIHSTQALQFRMWMTAVIKLFLVKGFVLDDVRLQQAQDNGKGFLQELLERMDELRS